MARQQPETVILDKIREMLRSKGAVSIKHHGSGYTRAGEPDIIGCHRGVAFAIEVKQPGEMPTKIQAQRLKEWAKAGAIVGVAHSVEEASQILSRIEEEHVRRNSSEAIEGVQRD